MRGRQESPWDRAGLFQRYFLCFMAPTFRRGYLNTLKENDLSEVPSEDRSELLGKRLNQQLTAFKLSKEGGFLKALLRTFSKELACILSLDLLVNCLAVPLGSIALGLVVKDLSAFQKASDLSDELRYLVSFNETLANQVEKSRGESHQSLMIHTFILISSIFLNCAINHSLYMRKNHLGMKFRIAIANLVYRKCLKLKHSALSETSIGQLINLLASDVVRFDSVPSNLCSICIAPIHAIIVCHLLILLYVGWIPTGILAGVIMTFALIQIISCRFISNQRAAVSKNTDQRVHLVYEIIAAIKTIKMHVWEKPFERLVRSSRQSELRGIEIAAVFRVINVTLALVSSKVFTVTVSVSYVLAGNALETSSLFVIIGLMNSVSLLLNCDFPTAISSLADTLDSSNRIDNFLDQPEMDMYRVVAQQDMQLSKNIGHPIVKLDDVNASWEVEQDLLGKTSNISDRKQVIRRLQMEVQVGELVLIVGRVGTGKSSLLMTILGELTPESGEVQVAGRISYASQEAWIFPGTLRDNILFGEEFEATRYKQVLTCCSLLLDLELFPNSDMTQIGERAACLSGGQKARVNLARALYRKAELYLLDDPLSAVDEQVATQIFNEAICGFLKTKTVLLTTHQLQFLAQASKVLVMGHNSEVQFGSLSEVSETGAFKELDFKVKTSEHKSRQYGKTKRQILATHRAYRALTPQSERYSSGSGSIASNLPSIPIVDHRRPIKPQPPVVKCNPISRLSSYFYYWKNGANWVMTVWFISICTFSQLVVEYIEFFLSLWTSANDENRRETFDARPILGRPKVERYFEDLSGAKMGRYCVFLCCLAILTIFLRLLTFHIISSRASEQIHEHLFYRIIRAPLTFFDSHSSGSILGLLGQDMLRVDETLPLSMNEVLMTVLMVTGSMILAAIVDLRYIVPGCVLILLAILVHHVTVSTIVGLKRMEGHVRAPILSHLSVSLTGLTAIRALKAQDQFVRQFEHHHDRYSSVSFAYIAAITIVSSIQFTLVFTFTSIVTCLMIGYSLDIANAPLIGLLIMKSLDLPQPLEWTTRKTVELESSISSVHRVQCFSKVQLERLEEEAVSVKFEEASGSKLVFSKVTLTYPGDDEPILHDISFSIKAGERVGILGRTGAGKSSILSILFRLYPFKGSVEIDGVNTDEMNLCKLRGSISVIPQEPVLFQGSLRENLDPFVRHSDETLWSLLDLVQLKSLVERSTRGLSFEIQESGSNLSIGQRQLICLARAILHKNKIVFLDEATASVDQETDTLIQKTIRQSLKHCTVVTIAHRLMTIADSDRVLILDQGRIVEFDEPQRLAADPKSFFSSMISNLNSSEWEKFSSLMEKRGPSQDSKNRNQSQNGRFK